MQRTVDKNTEKRIEQVAQKTNRLATKIKNPKTFEQKYKNHRWKNSNLHTTHCLDTNFYQTTEATKK